MATVCNYKSPYSDQLVALYEIWDHIKVLEAAICPRCAKGDPMCDEQFHGESHHTTGECKAHQFRMVSQALDDLRDEHFNEFNPEHIQRMGNKCLMCYRDKPNNQESEMESEPSEQLRGLPEAQELLRKVYDCMYSGERALDCIAQAGEPGSHLQTLEDIKQYASKRRKGILSTMSGKTIGDKS